MSVCVKVWIGSMWSHHYNTGGVWLCARAVVHKRRTLTSPCNLSNTRLSKALVLKNRIWTSTACITPPPPSYEKSAYLHTWVYFTSNISLRKSILVKYVVKTLSIQLHTFDTKSSMRILCLPSLNTLPYPDVNRFVLTGQYLNILYMTQSSPRI